MFENNFDPQPEITGDTLSIRPLKREDFDALFSAAGHPEVWAGHPANDRYKREKFEPYFASLLESKAAVAVVERQSGLIIGCSRYYVAPDQPGSVAIGFTFLNHAFWGGGTNYQLKRLMLGHAFETFRQVWFHIAPTNIRSQKATAKLGAEHVYDATLDLAGVSAPWMCFRLSRDAWNRVIEHKEMRD